MLFTTASTGRSSRNERSNSSASATRYSPVPRRAFVPSCRTRPPTITVGSSSAARRIAPVIEVVVVLPCPGDGDALLHAHHLGEHLGPLDDGRSARRPDLHVARVHGRGDDDDAARDLLGAVPLGVDADAFVSRCP
jgi:hypothetical protein